MSAIVALKPLTTCERIEMARSRRHRTRQTALGARFWSAYIALGAATCASAMAAAASLSWPAVNPAQAPAARHELNAVAALGAASADYRTAETENQAVLDLAPLTATAWVRKAYIRRQQSDRLDGEALDALERSYLAAPLGPDITRWRLRFMFECWPEVTPSLRARAIAELETFSRFHKGSYALARSIHDPSGRLAATLTARKTYREIAASKS